MIEPIMYLAIGFLVAILCGLILVPLVHNRAVRLTTRRLEAAAPMSMAEIQADKDLMRADYAMAARKLEISLERQRNKTTAQAAELGRKAEAIQRMHVEIGEQSATIFKLEAQAAEQKETLQKAERDLAITQQQLDAARATISELQGNLQTTSSERDETRALADKRQAEFNDMAAKTELLNSRITDVEATAKALREELAAKTESARELAEQLADARHSIENLTRRVAEQDAQLTSEIATRDALTQRTKELEAAHAERAAVAAKLEADTDRILKQASDAEAVARELRLQVTALSAGKQLPIDQLHDSKSRTEARLKKAMEDKAALQQEIRALKDRLGAEATAERAENAKLRERINEIAAEVAHLAMNLEGPDATIGAILAADSTKPGKKNAHMSLADRIRALQARAGAERAS